MADAEATGMAVSTGSSITATSGINGFATPTGTTASSTPLVTSPPSCQRSSSNVFTRAASFIVSAGVRRYLFRRSLSESCTNNASQTSTINSSLGSEHGSLRQSFEEDAAAATGMSSSPVHHSGQPLGVRHPQRRGAVVPLTLPEYELEFSCSTPLMGSPTHDDCLTNLPELLGLSSPLGVSAANTIPLVDADGNLQPIPLGLQRMCGGGNSNVQRSQDRFLWEPEVTGNAASAAAAKSAGIVGFGGVDSAGPVVPPPQPKRCGALRRLRMAPVRSESCDGGFPIDRRLRGKPIISVTDVHPAPPVASGAGAGRSGSAPCRAGVVPSVVTTGAGLLPGVAKQLPDLLSDDDDRNHLLAISAISRKSSMHGSLEHLDLSVPTLPMDRNGQSTFQETLRMLEHQQQRLLEAAERAESRLDVLSVRGMTTRPDSLLSLGGTGLVTTPAPGSRAPSPSGMSIRSHPAHPSNRRGGCPCMPLPSHPTPTPSPPDPTAGQHHSSFGTTSRTTKSGSGATGWSGRSESITSISNGSGGCLSGLRRGRHLVHQMSMDETRCRHACSVGRAAPSAATAAAAAAAPSVANAVANAVGHAGHRESSADFSYRNLKSSNASTSSAAQAAAAAVSAAASERRKKKLLNKQTNSAPDSLEDNSQFTDRLLITYYMDSEYNKGRSTYSRRSWQGDEGSDMLLRVDHGLGLRGRGDGCRDGSNSPYLNLPSPNVQNEETEADVFRKLSAFDERGDSDHDDVEAQGPPASALTRRRALVPPKLMSDPYESANDDHDPNERATSSHGSSESLTSTSHRKRRSSIVVIPPMQICPGDLLVYSKVLNHRNNLLGDFDGSTQSLAASDDSNRKGQKNTWSLLRLVVWAVFQFDRSSRTKSESLLNLDEVLGTITRSEFQDDQLAKYKGMKWLDFVSFSEDRRFSPDGVANDGSSVGAGATAASPGSGSGSKVQAATNTTSSYLSSCANRVNTCSTSPTRSPSSGSTGSGADTSPSRPEVNHHAAMAATCRNEQKRQEAVWDLFQSECLFLYDHLMVLKNVFMEPLKKVQVEGFAMFAEPEVLFGNLDELCIVTYKFCKEFISLLLQNMVNGELQTMEILVKLFQKSSKAMSLSQAYHRYALNYINALNYLEMLRRNTDFNEFEKWCSKDARCKKLQLTDLLVAPVQHIMKIPLILKDIDSLTQDPREKEIIQQILESQENSLRELDDKMKWLKNFERLLEVQRNIMWPSVVELDSKTFIPDCLKSALSRQPCERLIVSPRRQIIMEGALQLMESNKPIEMHVILFDDLLLITRRKKGLNKKKSSITDNWSTACRSGGPQNDPNPMRFVVYRQPLSLDRFYIHNIRAEDGNANKLENAFVLVNVNRFQQIIAVFTFQSPSDQIKTTWLTKLREAQERWKRTLERTVFRNSRLDQMDPDQPDHSGHPDQSGHQDHPSNADSSGSVK